MWLVLVALYGACAGSYLGVCADRLPENRSLLGGPTCGACGAAVPARDNVPVLAYLRLQGRCRACGTRIALR